MGGMALFFAGLALASAALLWLAFRTDRQIGWLTAVVLVVYLSGGVAMGEYLERVRGRMYFASDEVSYLESGRRLASDWRTGDSHTPVIPGMYPIWNGMLVYLYGGDSLLPMRLANGVFGAAAPLAGFVLARQLFGDLRTARLAALFIAISPSLMVWALTNLKERSLGTAIVFCIIAAIAAVKRWGLPQLAALFAAIVILGLLRHYYAAILGWLIIVGFGIAHRAPLRWRAARTAIVIVVVGAAQYPGSGSFLATSMTRESQIDDARRVLDEALKTEEQPAPVISQRVPEAPAPVSSTPAPTTPAATPPPSTPAATPAPVKKPSPAPAEATPPHPATTPPPASTESPVAVATPAQDARPDVLGQERSASLSGRALEVLLGQFRPQGESGRVVSAVLFPDWLMTLTLTPLAIAATLMTLRRRRYDVLIPAGFVAAMMGILVLMPLDSWAIYRFRAVYWPVLLTLSAGGAMWVFDRLRRTT